MGTRRTWLWVIIGVLGVGFVVLIAVAGAGVYFVTHHIQTRSTSDAEAMRALDGVRQMFQNARPLYEVDTSDEPHLTRPLTSIATSDSPATDIDILAWDPDHQHLVRMSLPLWLLRLGHQHAVVAGDDGRGFDLERLDLDADELARIGPTLVFDLRNRDGVRVLVWTGR
jgi:hypothetical protein